MALGEVSRELLAWLVYVRRDRTRSPRKPAFGQTVVAIRERYSRPSRKLAPCARVTLLVRRICGSGDTLEMRIWPCDLIPASVRAQYVYREERKATGQGPSV